jgi:hypothetical protein
VRGVRRVLRNPVEPAPAVVGHPELRSGGVDVVRVLGVPGRNRGDPAPEPVGDGIVVDRPGRVPAGLPGIVRRTAAGVDARPVERPRAWHLKPRVERPAREGEPDRSARRVRGQLAAADRPVAPVAATVGRLVDAGDAPVAWMGEGREEARRIRVHDEVAHGGARARERRRPGRAAVTGPEDRRVPRAVQRLRLAGSDEQHGSVQPFVPEDALPAVAAVLGTEQAGTEPVAAAQLGAE